MKSDLDNIRAEREPPLYQRAPVNIYSGLWKQIALGIIVGYSILGILSAIGWLIFIKLALGTLQINTL